jgi:hypothetical protein
MLDDPFSNSEALMKKGVMLVAVLRLTTAMNSSGESA